MESFLVAALYKFVPLPDYQELRAGILEACQTRGVNGTLLLAEEGINGTISGPHHGIHEVLRFLKEDPRFSDIEPKFSEASISPFYRMKVHLKKEIVTMGVEGINPCDTVGTYVDPLDWNAILSDPDILVVDARNDYEVAIGTFQGAINPDIQSFREFPSWLRDELKTCAEPKVAMFCTGGIRCEKSTSFLKKEGVQEVFHLKGGILKYLEHVPKEESKWLGECFVFDQRVSVKHGLEEGRFTLCRACRNPIDAQLMESPQFQEGVSCPHCFNSSTEKQKAGFAERQKQMELALSRGKQHLQ
ncbi:MAG: rhodanese-related sulfurtransferase [Planctomycetota bacterium]|nr:rhodanese-related sulfurtransferase [Planctomycetota bacterium]